MSWHSLAGLLALDLCFFASGAALVWGLRGFAAWSELFRLAGLAYLLGLSAVGVLSTEVLVAGRGVGVPTVLVLTAIVVACGLLLGRRAGRRRPSLRLRVEAREALLPLGVLSAIVMVVLLEILFRIAVFKGLNEWDAWAFWLQKAKAIYYFGHLDRQLFATLPGATYPLLVPALAAMGFHFMGSTDDVTLHVQMWLLVVAFVTAVGGLLRPRVPLAFIWPFLALLVIAPSFGGALNVLADYPLAFLFVVAALALSLWILRRETWLLASSGILLSAALATKREGQLLGFCLVLAGLLTTVRHWRSAWPRLLAIGAVAYLVNLPWRIWWMDHGFSGESAGTSWRQLIDNAGRIWPSFKLVLRLIFTYGDWYVCAPLGLAACGVLLLSGRRPLLVAYFLLTFVLVVLGYTWVNWSELELPLSVNDYSPIPRATAVLVLLSAAFAPLLLSEARQRHLEGPS